jgi:hypothetical protein
MNATYMRPSGKMRAGKDNCASLGQQNATNSANVFASPVARFALGASFVVALQ